MTNTSVLSDDDLSLFEEEWKETTNHHDLNTNNFIDPYLLSGLSTPESFSERCLDHDNLTPPFKIEGSGLHLNRLSPLEKVAFNVETSTSSQSSIWSIDPGQRIQTELDAILESFDNEQLYPCPSITSDAPASPYFGGAADGELTPPGFVPIHHHLAPALQHPKYAPSPLRHQMNRRSISEPPTGPPDGFDSGDMRHHLYQTPPRQMVFHRQGHYIGKPVPEEVAKVKERARSRALTRCQPYHRDASRGRSKRRQTPTSAPLPAVRSECESSASSSASRFADALARPVMSIAMSEDRLQMIVAEAVAKAMGSLRKGEVVSSNEDGEMMSETITVGSRD